MQRRHIPTRARVLTPTVLAVLGALSPAWALDRPLLPPDGKDWNCTVRSEGKRVCSFAGFDMTRANLDLSALRGSDFSNTLLPSASSWAGRPSAVRLAGAELVSGFTGSDAGIWLAAATSITGVQVRNNHLVTVSLAGRMLGGASFAGTGFDRVDFTGADITGVNLDRRRSGGVLVAQPSAVLRDAAVLAGVHFGGWRFSSSDLGGRVLDGARFDGATLAAGMFAGTSLAGASFEGALNFNAALLRNAGLDASGRALPTLRDVNLTGLRLSGADLRGLDLTGATLALRDAQINEGTVLARAKVTDAALWDQAQVLSLLSRADAASFAGVKLNGVQLANADLRSARLAGVSLAGGAVDRSLLARGAVLDGIDLSGTSGVTVQWLRQAAGATGLVELRGARLERLNLGNADLSSFVLDGASFANSVLGTVRVDERTSLVGADFSSARRAAGDPRGVFDSTTLRSLQPQTPGGPCRVCDARLGMVEGTSFQSLNLRGVQMQVTGRVDFSGADLSNADLRGSDLREVVRANAPVKLKGIDLSTRTQSGAGNTLGVRELIISAMQGGQPLDLSSSRLGVAGYQPLTPPVDLRNMDVRRVLFTGADLSGTDLTGVFSSSGTSAQRRADMQQSLSGSRLVGAIGITNAMLQLLTRGEDGKPFNPFDPLTGKPLGIVLSDQTLPRVVGFPDTVLPELGLAPTQWLKGFDLSNAGLTGWTLDRAVLDDAKLQRAVLTGASLVGARLIGVDLRGTTLARADLRGADLSSAKIYGTVLPGQPEAADRSNFRGAIFDGSTKFPERFAQYKIPLNAVDLGMQFRVGANRADELAAAGEDGRLPEISFEPGGTLVIPAQTKLTGETAITGSGTLVIPSGGRLLQQGGTIFGSGGDGLWLLGRVEGQGSLQGRINVVDTLARNSRASFDDLWLAASATLELVAADWRSGPLFSGTKTWLDGVLSIDFAGADLIDGDRLVVIAAGTIGGSFGNTAWRNLPQGTGLSLQLNREGTQLALAVSVTAVPEPATPLLATLGACLLWARMRRRGNRAHNPEH